MPTQNTIPVPFDNVMFLLRVIANYRKVAADNLVRSQSPEASDGSKEAFKGLADLAQAEADIRAQILGVILGDEARVVELSKLPEAQPK
jgi:hypothetical protein